MATEEYWFFNSTGSDRRVYNAYHFADYFADLYTSGIFHKTEHELSVTAAGGMQLAVADGGAGILGYRYRLKGGDYTLSVPLSNGANRVDRVVLRLSLEDNSIHLMYKQGGSAPPALERGGTFWELSLARVTVRADSANLAASDIVDERTDPNLCGWVRTTADPAYYPSGSLPEALWRYTMFPQSLTAAERAAVEGNPTLMSAFHLGRLKQLSDGLDASADSWVRIAEYKTAGPFTYTVPAGITRLGAYIGGGGGSGGIYEATGTADGYSSGSATGGASGFFQNIAPFAVTPGEGIAGEVGAGGAPVKPKIEHAMFGPLPSQSRGDAGEATSFHGVTAEGGGGGTLGQAGAYGGQSSSNNYRKAYAGGFVSSSDCIPSQTIQIINRYEPFRINGASGSGGSGSYSQGGSTVPAQYHETASSSYGRSGAGVSMGRKGGDATGNCNGGGGCAYGPTAEGSGMGESGAGSPGMVLIYARRSEAVAAGVTILD